MNDESVDNNGKSSSPTVRLAPFPETVPTKVLVTFFNPFKYFITKKSAILPMEATLSDVNEEKNCLMCYESYGVSKRKCCNALYCDHCYTKDKKCPNCDKATRQEKMTGATFQLAVYSEHEECRICLDPGLKRRCCGNYYCDDCYYAFPKCRSCKQSVGSKRFNSNMTSAVLISVLTGWMVTIFLCTAVAGLIVVVSVSESATPVTLWKYKCYGFFRSCDSTFCVTSSKSVANGSEAIAPLTSWIACDDNSEVKLEGPGCVYDQQMYIASDGVLGYDICASTYNNGVYIFEDLFQSWKNGTFASNTMKSAKWHNVFHGTPNDGCVSSVTALTFYGSLERFAETIDLDVSSGGRVQASMFMAPIGFDVTHPKCKTAYSSYVTVDFSVDGGVSWSTIQRYDAFIHRSTDFFDVDVEIPSSAVTHSTRFRFYQRNFEEALDAWALKYVRVLRYLPQNWAGSSHFDSNLITTAREIQLAQCCYDTDWCIQRFTAEEIDSCKQYSWYKQDKPNYKFRESEIFIFAVFILNLIKFVYVTVQDWLMRRRVPFHDELLEIFSLEWVYKHLPAKYRPKRTLDDYTSNIHLSARLIQDLKDAFNDEEGDGNMIMKREEMERIKKEKREKIRREKKKLRARAKHKNYKGPRYRVQDDDEIDEKQSSEKEIDPFANDFGVDKVADSKDKLKRQNMSLSKIAFDTKVDTNWTRGFAATAFSVFVIMSLFKIFTTAYYALHQVVYPYGLAEETISMTSAAIILFAMYGDFKEIYHTVKYIIPCRPSWVPYVTVDLTEDVNGLFVGKFQVSMDDIAGATAFSLNFMKFCAFSFCFGCFPWCLFSIIIRDQYLEYEAMRIVSPMFGVLIILRAVLGPGFLLKLAFSLGYILDYDIGVRQEIGRAIQATKSLIGAAIASFAFGTFAAFICSAIYLPFTGIAFGLAFAGGLLYGLFSGCYHSLPIRPWMCITTIEAGVWVRVKQKKERCSFKKGGLCCTDLHLSEEMLVVLVTDSVKFSNIMKYGMSTGS